MGILVEWEDSEQTAIQMVYENCWNWRDHSIAIEVVNTLLETVDHPVDLIINLEQSLPLADCTEWQVYQAPQRLHENWSGTALVITPDGEMARAILDATPSFSSRTRAATQEPTAA